MSFSYSKTKTPETNTVGRVWEGQAPYLQDLYAQGYSQLPQMNDMADQASSQYLKHQTVPGRDSDAEIAYQNARQSFGDTLGQDNVYGQTGQQAAGALQGFLGGDPVQNPYLQANVDRAFSSVNNNLQRNILPMIGGEAAQAGQYGSSRHGIAEGLALSDANSQATGMAQEMYSNAYDQGMQNRLNAAQQSQGLMNAGTQAGLAEQQGYQNLFNLGMLEGGAYDRAAASQYQPLAAYAQLLGSPTTLSNTNVPSTSSMSLGLGYSGPVG